MLIISAYFIFKALFSLKNNKKKIEEKKSSEYASLTVQGPITSAAGDILKLFVIENKA